MAEFTARFGVDMRDFDTLDQIVLATDDRVVVAEGNLELVYGGDFRFPGGAWSGLVETAALSEAGVLVWEVTGLDLPARLVRPGADPRRALERAFSGDDSVAGSSEDDVLLGYDGDDRVSGGAGSDELAGDAGDDLLDGGLGMDLMDGGGGGDRLRGGGGSDLLFGGTGRDVLWGDAGRDLFLFDDRTGADIVRDYQAGREKIFIAAGAERFGDLQLSERGGDALVEYDGNSIRLAGVDLDDLGRRDFTFEL